MRADAALKLCVGGVGGKRAIVVILLVAFKLRMYCFDNNRVQNYRL